VIPAKCPGQLYKLAQGKSGRNNHLPTFGVC